VTFVLKLFFTGLMAFIPNQNGTEVTVLLLNVPHDYAISDSTPLAHHKPLLLARAGECSGDCPTRDADIAQFVYADQSQSEALDSLEAAVSGGGAWALDGSELSLHKGSGQANDLPALVIRNDARGSVNGVPNIIPATADEREDFSWIASLHSVCPSCSLDSNVLADPPPGLIAARFHLRSGKVFTYSVAKIGSDVTPVHFQRLDSAGSASSYSQAVATWVGAEIEVSGDNVQIVEDKFDNGTGRSMTLAPDEDGKVEVAVVNLPPFVPPASAATSTAVGKHFEAYYELTQTPPSQATRLVPQPGAATGAPEYSEVGWSSIHPQDVLWSDLLNALRMNIGRSMYEQVLCPPTTWP
jgi:hypothetical protein